MSWHSEVRKPHLVPHLRPGISALEIGAYAAPTLVGVDARCKYVDFYSTEELREQARQIGQDPDAVVAVDYVVRGEDYRDVVKERFDLVIANHVLEHICNPIKWINMIADLLNDDGMLFIALPDKRFSFDRYRSNTDVAHLVTNFLMDEKVTSPEHVIETIIYYDMTNIGQKMDLKQSLNPDRLRAEMHSPHPGIHVHVFDGLSFLSKILKPILFMKLVPFHLVGYQAETPAGEFYFLLRKGWQPVELTEEEFYSLPAPAAAPAAQASAVDQVSTPAATADATAAHSDREVSAVTNSTHSVWTDLLRWLKRNAN